MGSSYAEKLKDVRWQKKRLAVLERSGWVCEQCAVKKSFLNVHHYWYEPGVEPWDYADDCYAALCEPCHKLWHATKAILDRRVAGMGLLDLKRTAALADGVKAAIHCEDKVFSPNSDPLEVAAFIRGFWPPPEYTNKILDACLLRMKEGQPARFSTILAEVVPDSSSYTHAWIRHAAKGEIHGG